MPYKDTKSDTQWRKKNIRHIGLNFMRNSEGDVIEWIEKQPSMQGAIKDLIRAEIARETQTADSNR